MGSFYASRVSLSVAILSLGACSSTTPKIETTEIDKGVEVEIAIKAPSILGAYLPQLVFRARAYEGLKEKVWEMGGD
jgi:hypothetical protein